MNYKIFVLFFISFLAFSQETVTLTIQAENLPNKKGNLRMAVFNNPNDFLKKSEFTCVEPINKTTKCSFIIPKGNYSIAVFHDENMNSDLDKNVLGIPIEAYGFSNNARPRFRYPRFKEALITISESKSIKISTKTWF